MSLRAAIRLCPLVALAACGEGGDAPVEGQRIAFDEIGAPARAPLPSPDTGEASWRVTPDGQAIGFGNAGAAPFLTLACRIAEVPPRIEIIRHAPARPGEKALFPVIGNGTIARFKLDAALESGEWRWQGSVPADDALLEVFTGQRDLEATLPGAGTLLIAGSGIPGEFIRWCRAGADVGQAVTEERAGDEG